MASRSVERQRSLSISLFFHLLFFLFLFFYHVEYEAPVREFIEIGFGGDGTSTFSGIPGVQNEETLPEESAAVPAEKSDVDLPKANEHPEDVAIKKETDKKPVETQKTGTDKKEETNTNNSTSTTSGGGGMGYDIDWGGLGQRKIYSYSLPSYPEGVNKNIDIRVRFTILPDGTVGSVFLLTKADTKLENAALASLRQWRFEPLPSKQNQVTQVAVITFPYRIR